MEALNSSDLARKIQSFTSQPGNILFAGAGIGMRIGLPSWPGLMNYLADVCKEYNENDEAGLILKRKSEGDYLGAATIYKTCRAIPPSERNRRLAIPFNGTVSAENTARLECLARLPLSSVVTTNYDRHFYNVLAKVRQVSPLPLELDDETLRNGVSRTEFFFARIHGRAEHPHTLKLDNTDYVGLLSNDVYLDFLASLLAHRPTLFVGFSFVDPAIDSVLSVFKKTCGPNFPKLHLAVLPSDCPSSLPARLAEVNIEVVLYAPVEDHADLWRSFREAEIAVSSKAEEPPTSSSARIPALNHSETHRFLAYSYARLKSPDTVLDPVIRNVQDSLVLSVIEESQGTSIERVHIHQRLKEILKIEGEAVTQIMEDSVTRLNTQKLVVVTGRYLQSKSFGRNAFDESMHVLLNGITNRYKVLWKSALSDKDHSVIQLIIESIVMVRAWDFAAQYSGGLPAQVLGLESSVKRIVYDGGTNIASRKDWLVDCIIDLFRSPGDAEAKVISELSRTAFALQVVLESPRYSLFHKYSLPEKLHFDASILMPAITNGHPLRPVYLDVLTRLRQAVKQNHGNLELQVGEQFLEEIIAHRESGIALVAQLKLEEERRLIQHISFYGASNTNVFVGAFATHYPKYRTFKDFLATEAPYQSINELRTFLKAHGFESKVMDFRQQHNSTFNHLFSELIEGYEDEQRSGSKKRKERILIQHEAQQLTQLLIERKSSVRSIFVTADARLQRVMQGTENLSQLLGSVLSGIGLIGLVDLMVGTQVDDRSFARLIWSMPRTDIAKQLQDYLVQLALSKYDEALAMAMSSVLDAVSSAGVEELRLSNLDLRNATNVEDAARTAQFLDRLENRFFAEMAKVVEKREKEGW